MSGSSEWEEEETYRRLQAASEKMDAWRAELLRLFGREAHYSDAEFEAMLAVLREEMGRADP